MKTFINADLGESETRTRTRALMRIVDFANIACGAHAGNLATMDHAVSAAKTAGVKIGAHPGMADRHGFGRIPVDITPDALRMLLLSQVATLATVAKRHKTELHHVKLHGALYHQVESTPLLAATYLETLADYFPKLSVITMMGGEVEKIAPSLGIRIFREAFADRGYDAWGKLIPRTHPGAMLLSANAVKQQLLTFITDGVCGLGKPDTICIHSDTPNALKIARITRAALTL